MRVPLAMMNRHGLDRRARPAPARPRRCSSWPSSSRPPGVPVFLADMKGDLSGIGVAGRGERPRRRSARKETGYAWRPPPCPVEFLSLTGQARRAAARDRVVVRAAAARQGARPERDADERARAGLQVLRRPRARAARLRRPARRAAAPDRRRRGRAQGLRRHVEGDASACCCARWSSSSSRARSRSSASPSSSSTTCSRSSATAAGS